MTNNCNYGTAYRIEFRKLATGTAEDGSDWGFAYVDIPHYYNFLSTTLGGEADDPELGKHIIFASTLGFNAPLEKLFDPNVAHRSKVKVTPVTDGSAGAVFYLPIIHWEGR